jgi:hypothetical protein
LGTYLGTYQKIRLRTEKTEEGSRYHAIGDLHLSESAKETPNGNLYDYVLSLAKDSPDMFGSSIVFQGNEYQEENEEGEMVSYATIQSLMATDLVDTPAATDGLFSMNENDLASQMTMFLDENPRIFELVSKKPEIIEEFLSKYKLYTEKVSTKKEKMSLFKKDKPLSKIMLGEIEAVYQGELKEGTEFNAIGAEIPDGAYEDGDQIYNVEKSTLKSIETKQPEMFSEDQVTDKIDAAVNPLKEELQEKDQEIVNLKASIEEKDAAYEELQKERDEMAKLTSTHKPKIVQKVDNSKDVPLSEEEHLRKLAQKYNQKPKTEE